MSQVHVVRQGEYLSSIASQYGFASWEKVYEHAENAEFRKKRPDPNVIHAGDRIVIPDLDTHQESAATKKKHRFRRKDPPVRVRIRLRDEQGEALASTECVLVIEEEEHTVRTDADGLLEHEIPCGVADALLRIPTKNMNLPLRIGHLDPTGDENAREQIVSGMQSRLNNMGFYCGPVDDNAGDRTRAALRAFQRQVLGRVEPDGEPDQETLDALVREYGC